MKVDDCMCCNVTSVKLDDTLKQCAKIMSNENIGCVPVCDGDNLVGIVSNVRISNKKNTNNGKWKSSWNANIRRFSFRQ